MSQVGSAECQIHYEDLCAIYLQYSVVVVCDDHMFTKSCAKQPRQTCHGTYQDLNLTTATNLTHKCHWVEQGRGSLAGLVRGQQMTFKATDCFDMLRNQTSNSHEHYVTSLKLLKTWGNTTHLNRHRVLSLISPSSDFVSEAGTQQAVRLQAIRAVLWGHNRLFPTRWVHCTMFREVLPTLVKNESLAVLSSPCQPHLRWPQAASPRNKHPNDIAIDQQEVENLLSEDCKQYNSIDSVSKVNVWSW